MALTDSSDFFGSFREDGINRILQHVQAKRPSLFNYGTQLVADEWRKLLCCPPDVAPEVIDRFNPVVTVESPLPIVGTGGLYSLNWAAQLARFEIDFEPSSFELPEELGGKLTKQQFAIRALVCAGVGCPPDWVYEEFPPPPVEPIDIDGKDDSGQTRPPVGRVQRDPVVLPVDDGLACFHLNLYATGHAEVNGPEGFEVVELKLDGFEIVDVEPRGLEQSLECYIEALVRYVVLPRLRVALPVFVLDLPLDLGTTTISAADGVPNNPAIEDDQIKVFVDMEVA